MLLKFIALKLQNYQKITTISLLDARPLIICAGVRNPNVASR